MAAAHDAGIDLGGSGWRSASQQIALRAANCRPTLSGGVACRPATAPPGTSRHERGLAIDFTVGRGGAAGRLTGVRVAVQHASEYGLRNLPSEPWHWSVDGW